MGTGNAPEARALGQLFGDLIATAVVAYAVWSTVVAFGGGRVPLTRWHIAGGIVTGVAWALVAVPLVAWTGAFAVAATLVAVRLVVRARARSARRPVRGPLRVVR